ncbi:hypothetical protein [Rubrivirga sp. IMCC43871]|uniref:hypothetical protein n=1 Tax=Rubrivirga sp. IMCC43871 TaxID=3391575 RepID=UPI00398FCB67
MRLALLAAFLLASGCHDFTETYTHKPGEFDPDSMPGIERLRADAAAGDPDAQFRLAFYEHPMTGDPAGAIPTLRRLAADGHPGATSAMAAAYRDGQGVAQDDAQAALWLERAAALGDEDAARDLAAYRAHVEASGTETAAP